MVSTQWATRSFSKARTIAMETAYITLQHRVDLSLMDGRHAVGLALLLGCLDTFQVSENLKNLTKYTKISFKF